MPTTAPDALVVAETSPTGAEIPDPDRTVPPGLRWTTPLESRPIILGRDHPEIRPVLDLQAGRFWTASRHGLAIGRAERTLHNAAMDFAFAPDLRAAQVQQAALAHAGSDLDAAMDSYIKEIS